VLATTVLAPAARAAEGNIYVANLRDNDVSVIDPATNTVVTTVPVGRFPIADAVSPDGSQVWVVNDLATNTVTTNVGVGSLPYTLATGPAVTKPTVTGLVPTSGPLAGGTTVTITGTNLTGATAVSFGSTPATSFTVTSDTSIMAVAPASSSVGTVDVTVTTPSGTSATSPADHYSHVYPFRGFFAPITNPPTVDEANAGRTIPIKFSLGGAYGLNILAAGSPTATQVSCTTGAPLGPPVPTSTAGNSGLQFDPTSGTYTYTWKTLKAYAGTCQLLTLTLNDGTSHTANFQFD
jgi:YVTN family beta-propeller protein